jgi:hypothetical protein
MTSLDQIGRLALGAVQLTDAERDWLENGEVADEPPNDRRPETSAWA